MRKVSEIFYFTLYFVWFSYKKLWLICMIQFVKASHQPRLNQSVSRQNQTSEQTNKKHSFLIHIGFVAVFSAFIAREKQLLTQQWSRLLTAWMTCAGRSLVGHPVPLLHLQPGWISHNSCRLRSTHNTLLQGKHYTHTHIPMSPPTHKQNT